MSTINNGKEQIKREPDKTLFVGGIDELVTEEQFKSYFEPFGKIVDLKLLSGRKCGFIQYEAQEDAEKALNTMNGQIVGRFPVRVSWRNSNILASPNKKTPKKEYNSYEDDNKFIEPPPPIIPLIPMIPTYETQQIQLSPYERPYQMNTSPYYPKYQQPYGNYQVERQEVSFFLYFTVRFLTIKEVLMNTRILALIKREQGMKTMIKMKKFNFKREF